MLHCQLRQCYFCSILFLSFVTFVTETAHCHVTQFTALGRMLSHFRPIQRI